MNPDAPDGCDEYLRSTLILDGEHVWKPTIT
jgi:hypothetical protein